MNRFRSGSEHKVDAKGRVSIPASFRRVLESEDPNWTQGGAPELVIVFGMKGQKYLEGYTINAINEIDEKISALPRGSDKRKVLEHIFYACSFNAVIDDSGRLVLPAPHREKIGLTNKAHFEPSGDTFKIWAPEIYETTQEAEVEKLFAQDVDTPDPLIYLDGV